MNSEYFVGVPAFGGYPEFSISEDDYLKVTAARSTLRDAFDFEQRYHILYLNYEDILRFRDNLSTDLDSFEEYLSSTFRVICEANRLLSNLLTTARAYTDQTPQSFKVWSDGNFSTLFETQVSVQFDKSLGFRLMSALRNFVQHRSMPCSQLAIKFNQPQIQKAQISVIGQRKMLEEDGLVRRKTMRELPQDFDLIQACSEYVAGLSSVHASIRRALEPSVSVARGTIEIWAQKYREEFPDVPQDAPLAAIHRTPHSPGLFLKVESLNLLWDANRITLAQANQEFEHTGAKLTPVEL